MKLIDMTCPKCGAQLKLDIEKKQAFCQHCGAEILIDDEVQHIQYDNAEEAGYRFEKGRQRAQAEARQAMNQNVAPASSNQNTIKKKRTWLWVLGWIFVFPIPLMILLLRKKNMNPVLKYGIIAAAWIVYLAIGLSGNSDTENTGEVDTTKVASATSVSSMTQEVVLKNDEVADTPEENIVEANEEVSAASIEDSKEEIKEEIEMQQDIVYIDLDDLQQLFCDLSSANTRSEINDIVKEKGLSVHWFQGYHYNAASCYVGMDATAVSDRPRDREGAVIDIHFMHDGTIEKMGYTTGGSASFFSDFKLTYENGEFHYAGEDYEDGEEAMQLYLANH